LHYTTSPGKTYVIEPAGGELDYDLVYKSPLKFYDQVMTQQITQHKVTDSKKPNECELSTKVTLRKIGRILMIVQNNIVELLRREGKWDQADVEAAMRDSNVKQVV
jgi:hypothetical protein